MKEKKIRINKEAVRINQKRSLREDQRMARLVEALVPEEREALLSVFDSFDTDNSGLLTRKEITMALREFNIFDTPQAEAACVDGWFHVIDKNRDNRMSKDEFLRLMAVGMKLPMTEEELTESFKVFDTDGSDTISAKELKHAISGLGPTYLSEMECDELLQFLDTNNSGALISRSSWQLSLRMTSERRGANWRR